jgi:SAM-dependent methyltransferase
MSDERPSFDKQVGVWDRMSEFYETEIDVRFAPIVHMMTALADAGPGDEVLDLGTGTGSLAIAIATAADRVTAVDISPEMLEVAAARANRAGVGNVVFKEGSAESIPAKDGSFDIVVSSLCLMFVIDKEKAAAEIARVLRPGGRFIASVWGGPDECDIVKFQSIAGSFSPDPPAPGSGPGSLADPSDLINYLSRAGLETSVQKEVAGFEFPDLQSAWNVLAGVTTSDLSAEERKRAMEAVRSEMWPEPDRPRTFRNLTQFILGKK